MPRPTPRLVVALALLLGLTVLSVPGAPPAVADAPSNDKFGNALKIGSLPFHKSENTRQATSQDSDPVPSCQGAGRTVWFKLRRGSDTPIIADTEGSNRNGETYDTVLVAYEQKGKGVDGLVEVACSDDALPNNLSEITFVAEADTTYYLMVGTCCGATAVPGGDLKLNVEKLKS